MTEQGFVHGEDDLRQLAADALAEAKRQGADGVEVEFGESFGLDVGVRDGRPESIESSQQLSAGVEVHLGQKVGSASCNSFAPADIATTIERSLVIARQMNEDDCNGLPDPALLATEPAPDLDQYHPWRPAVGEALRLAGEMAEASWAVDGRISRDKSEGASVSAHEARSVLANSLGFMASSTRSLVSMSCAVLAELEEGMESEGWHDSKRAVGDLEDHHAIARRAAKRAVARAGVRPIKSARLPVLFETGVAHRFMGALMGGIGGNAVYRKLTYLGDLLGKQVCADHVTISEDPFVPRGERSTHHDAEGVRTAAKDLVRAGVLQSFLLGSYSARKLKAASTGNSGGTHNLNIEYRAMEFAALLQEMGRGLLVTATMGGGANFVTGDYSAGASGFWVEDGAIAHPVKDATIAGDLREIYAGIVAGGTDRHTFGGTNCGSVLVAEMAVGGNN